MPRAGEEVSARFNGGNDPRYGSRTTRATPCARKALSPPQLAASFRQLLARADMAADVADVRFRHAGADARGSPGISPDPLRFLDWPLLVCALFSGKKRQWGGAPMKDYQASIEKLRSDAAEAALIRDFATDRTKREMFARLHEHLNRLADEVEQAMKSSKRSG